MSRDVYGEGPWPGQCGMRRQPLYEHTRPRRLSFLQMECCGLRYTQRGGIARLSVRELVLEDGIRVCASARNPIR